MKRLLKSDRFILLLAERPFLRRLFLDFWFRMAFLAFIFLVLFLGLSLPRMWRTTPAGFKPIIRISGLDWAQSFALKRSARSAAQTGRVADAEYAWHAAIVHTPANTDLLREALRFAKTVPPTPKRMINVVAYAEWLLRLANTNSTDVSLVCGVYDKFRLYEQVLSLLEPLESQLSPDDECLYLKALFNQGQVHAFRQRWDTKMKDGAKLNDPEMALYHSAYLAGWGPTETMVEARNKLKQADQDPNQALIANRLLLAVSAQRQDVEAYDQILKRLQALKADSLHEHVGYWTLLAMRGQTNQAVALATGYSAEPTSSVELIRLADGLAMLGLKEQALTLFEKYAPVFDTLPAWLSYIRLLIDNEKWDDLVSAAVQLRQTSALREQLLDYSFFLEGRACLAQGKIGLAETAFEKASQYDFINPALGYTAAAELTRLGYYEHAKKILNGIEKSGRNSVQYWMLAARTAFELKQHEGLLTAAARAYELGPKDPMVRNYYAASLLITREKPAEAVRLTFELMNETPQVVGFRLNHALALLHNNRPNDVQTILDSLRPLDFNSEERNTYHQVMFELNLQQKRWAEARSSLRQIDRQRLFPVQVTWLENQEKLLNSQSPAAP